MADLENTNNIETNEGPEKNDENRGLSPPEQLADLVAKATAAYAIKDYTPAAELYSQATELQAEINGEMSVENADLLYAYGRCLFYVAQKTSTVLGGTAAQAQLQTNEKKSSKKRKSNGSTKSEHVKDSAQEVIKTPAAADVVPESEVRPEEQKSDKPYFQFTGDENFEDSSDEEDDGDGDDDDEDADDFGTSFELLDLARVLFSRKLDELAQAESESSDKEKSTDSPQQSQPVRDIKTRIADIYDLQAEISLEGEKYAAAVEDLRSCLKLKLELEPPDSSLLAECHYKLSLALEVAGQDQQRDADGNPTGPVTIDWDVRNEAIAEQSAAIDSCKLRIANEKATLSSLPESDPQYQRSKEQIDDVQEMVEQMEDRLGDLKKPPVSARATADSEMSKELMAGVLGQMLSADSSKEDQKKALEQVIASANDLSGAVKRKKRKTPNVADDTASNASGVSTGSKRKVQFVDDVDEHSGANGKKAKVEEVEDSGQ